MVKDDPRLQTLKPREVMEILGIGWEALKSLHASGEGPPRYKASPRNWRYPVIEFQVWQKQRLAEAAALETVAGAKFKVRYKRQRELITGYKRASTPTEAA